MNKQVSDDNLLSMIRLRVGGMSVKNIAKHYGKSQQYVSTATTRVKRADEAHEGRCLMSDYWPG